MDVPLIGSREKRVVDPMLLISLSDQLCACLPRRRRTSFKTASLTSMQDGATVATSPSLQQVQ